jgi:hypothetical protein
MPYAPIQFAVGGHLFGGAIESLRNGPAALRGGRRDGRREPLSLLENNVCASGLRLSDAGGTAPDEMEQTLK